MLHSCLHNFHVSLHEALRVVVIGVVHAILVVVRAHIACRDVRIRFSAARAVRWILLLVLVVEVETSSLGWAGDCTKGLVAPRVLMTGGLFSPWRPLSVLGAVFRILLLRCPRRGLDIVWAQIDCSSLLSGLTASHLCRQESFPGYFIVATSVCRQRAED